MKLLSLKLIFEPYDPLVPLYWERTEGYIIRGPGSVEGRIITVKWC